MLKSCEGPHFAWKTQACKRPLMATVERDTSNCGSRGLCSAVLQELHPQRGGPGGLWFWPAGIIRLRMPELFSQGTDPAEACVASSVASPHVYRLWLTGGVPGCDMTNRTGFYRGPDIDRYGFQYILSGDLLFYLFGGLCRTDCDR